MTEIYLKGNVQAPTVQEIIDDPDEIQQREEETFYALRTKDLEQLEYGPYQDGKYSSIIKTSEANALQDFRDKMISAAETLEDSGNAHYRPYAERSRLFPRELRFIGNKEFDEGVDSIAKHWHDRLQSGRGELLVGVEKKSSSAYVFSHVFNRLCQIDKEAASYITPFNTFTFINYSSAGIIDRLKGVFTDTFLVDDWTVSGQTMSDISRTIARCLKSPDELEINVICSTDKHLQEGISGIRTKSHFTRPYTDSIEMPDGITITGSHSNVDYGFRNYLAHIYSRIRETTPAAWPLLSFAAKIYNPGDAYYPDEGYIDQLAKYNKVASYIIELPTLENYIAAKA